MITLRDYQEAMLDEARAHMRAGRRRILLVAPTGSGKRMMACHTIAAAAERGKRCGFLVHRRELLDQSSRTLCEAGVPHGVIAAGTASTRQPVQVASIQTLARRRVEPFDFLFVDESHHSASATWSALLESMPGAWVLGFTATPERLDGKGLGPYFDAMVQGPGVAELTAAGYLSRYRLFAPPAPALGSVRTVAGDYDRGQLAKVIDRPQIVGDVVGHYGRLVRPRRALVYAVNRVHARHLALGLRGAGVAAEYVGGDTPEHERRDLVAAFAAAGRVEALCSVDILGEGLDVPGVEAVVLARPTRSLTLYLQQVGRGLRVKPGGGDCLVLDHAGNVHRHGLPDAPREWQLTAGKVKRQVRGIANCPSCFACMPQPAPAKCPHCGAAMRHAASGRQRYDVVTGELVETDAAMQAEAAAKRARRLRYLIELGRRRGYRHPEGWARHVLAARQRVSLT